MPNRQATTIAAHASLLCAMAFSLLIKTPKARNAGPPKNSPTTAPIIARVALIFSALKIYGSALGIRNFAKTVTGFAAYERINSSDAGEHVVKPLKALS